MDKILPNTDDKTRWSPSLCADARALDGALAGWLGGDSLPSYSAPLDLISLYVRTYIQMGLAATILPASCWCRIWGSRDVASGTYVTIDFLGTFLKIK